MSTKEATFAKNVVKRELAQLVREGKNVGSEDIRKMYEKSLRFYSERRDLLETTGKA